MEAAKEILERVPVIKAERQLSLDLWWYAQRECWRFPYRDPFTRERKFLNCTADRFEEAGIPLPDPTVVRKATKTAQNLAKQLQTVFLRSLRAVRPETFEQATPMLSVAIEKFHALGDDRVAGYRSTLRTICQEFLEVAGDKSVDRITDEDLKAYQNRITPRLVLVSVRSYLRQLGMFIEFACRKGWIRADPRLTFRVPREEIRDPDPLTDDDVKAFFRICRAPVLGHPKGWAYLEWIGTGFLCLGLRSIELEYARWENVDWKERFIFVARSHGAKERQARQLQPIPLAAMPAFEAHRKTAGPVWTGYFGEPVSAGILHRARESLQKQIPGFRWKRFRKTFATIVAAGNDDMMVSRLLRHSAGGKNISIAHKHYVGKSHALLRAVVDEAFGAYAGMMFTSPIVPIQSVEAGRPETVWNFGPDKSAPVHVEIERLSRR
jgi:integrase